MSSVMSLQDENRVLQGELARLEDLLAHSRADRDELAIKYGAISERVSWGLTTDVIGNRLSPQSSSCNESQSQETTDVFRRLQRTLP